MRSSGERQPDGTYPEGSVNRLVDARPREMGETMRRLAQKTRAEPDGEKENERQV